MITATLQRAWTDISGFLVVITIMFMAYSITVCRFPHKTQHAICLWECRANSDEMSTFQTNLMYGWKLCSYRTLLDAAQTMISLQLGIFNYEEVSVIINDPKLDKTQELFILWLMSLYKICVIFQVLNYNPVLGAFLIGSCIVFMTFVVLNLFISVILVAFSQEQIHHQVTHIYKYSKARCVTIQ